MDNGQPDETDELVVEGKERRISRDELQRKSLQELDDESLLGLGAEDLPVNKDDDA